MQIIWGRVSCTFVICQSVPGKQLHECTAAPSLWQSRAKSQHQDSLPSAGVPASVPGNSAAHWCHTFFCPRRHLATTPKCTPSMELFLPVQPRDPRPCCLFPGVCPSSPQEHPKPEMTPVVGRLLTLQNLHSAAYNIL